MSETIKKCKMADYYVEIEESGMHFAAESSYSANESTGNRRKRYTFEEKKIILEEAKTSSIQEICAKYGISDGVLRKWKANQEVIENAAQTSGTKTLKKVPKTSELDTELLSWLADCHEKAIPVSGPMLCRQALVINSKIGGPENFKASHGWLEAWKKRTHIKNFPHNKSPPNKILPNKIPQNKNPQNKNPQKISTVTLKKKMAVRKIIVDCDAGTDDALALIILIAAHKEKKIELKGIMCVGGNTSLDNVICNVYRTLEICGQLDIPVYKGASSSLLKFESSSARIKAAQYYHGCDGLGDAFTDKQDCGKLQAEHAVIALSRIVAANPGEITVVCLAPLTNIALAIKMYPGFCHSVKELYVMGGNSTAKGNVTAQAEFNFFADPESVHIVLDSMMKPVFLLPWESCLNVIIPQAWRTNVLGNIDTDIVRFLDAIESGINKGIKERSYNPCDAFLAAIVVKPEMIEEQEDFHADIELKGDRTRGQVVLDHLQSRTPNVRLINTVNSEIFKQILISAVQSC